MTNFLNERSEIGDWRLREASNLQSLISTLFLLLTLLTLYLLTLAQSPVLGDPSEYTFVANMLGIAHPPGYAFITLLGKLFQSIVPIGSIAWRMHLLAAVSASLGAYFVFGTIRTVARKVQLLREVELLGTVAALFGAFVVGTAVNHWQHAIHANPHILTATFLAANLYFLTRWWADGASRNFFLYLFCGTAGLGITHHPLTVFGFPAYTIFIGNVWLNQEIRDWRLEIGNARLNLQSLITNLHRMVQHNWHTVLKMIGLALLGLSVWLYFPIRSPMDPGFGPTTMNTLDGFLDHVLARGLSNTLPYFALADQPDRATVFWSLLRLQYTWPVIGLAILGVILPLFRIPYFVFRLDSKRDSLQQPIVLYLLAFLGTYAFVISLRAQDIMAYLIGPFLVVGLFAGLGLLWLLQIVVNWTRTNADERGFFSPRLRASALGFLILLAFVVGPIWQLWQNAPHVSLRDYNEGQAVIEAVEHWADEQESGAALLSDWERMTPLWHERYVNNNWPETAVVTPKLVAAGTENPWLTAIFDNLLIGPVYLSNYRPNVLAGTELRLRPSGLFYQVIEPGDQSVPHEMTEVTAVVHEIEIIAYELPQHHVTAGDFVPLTLAVRSPSGTSDFYVPVLYVGELRYEFTTDSHLISPNWWAGEVIIERFDFALPHDLTSGAYPLRLNVKNLSQNEEIELNVSLGILDVAAQENPPATDHLLANFRHRVGLLGGTVRHDGTRLQAPWTLENALTVQPGDTLNVSLEWEALAKAEESYTIFVHLIDENNVPHVFLDYTPLGGSAPTHLWIPKWLPGQRFIDPYRLTIPPDLPPGTYFIEVGLYEMVSSRRLHISDSTGNLNGDRYILGAVKVIE